QEEAVPTSAPTESNDSVESTGTDTASPVVPPTAPVEPVEEDPTVPPEGGEGGPDDHPYWDPELNLLSWSSPTGNISCHLQATAEIVTCTAFEHSIEPAENCHAAQPVVAELEPGGVHQGCRSDVTPVGRVLPYGESIVMGSITCISLETGMTCDNGDLA